MDRFRIIIASLTVTSVVFAQPALTEPPDYPASRPGAVGVHDGSSCFLLAAGTIAPGDVDWVRVQIPWATSRTVVDVDFPVGSGSSVLLASRVGGTTGLGMADGNNARDALCGLSGSTMPPGSPTDSAIEVGATPSHALIDIGLSGFPDTSFLGQHTQTFSYEVWVYINPLMCTSDANCNDSVACTTETCDVATGICNITPNHAECMDSSYCNGAEVCDTQLGCRSGTPVNCSDGISCTIDSCNENLDSCVHVPVNSSCSNGQFCDGVEWCDADLGCQAGTPEVCDDSEDCTVDTCDPDIDDCLFTSSEDACDDGIFCNGRETCDQSSGCAPGEDPCPGSMCDESLDRCSECLSDSDCDDGVFCNGSEQCDTNSGSCEAGAAPDCDDDVDCTADSCNEAQNRCVHAPVHAACNDGQFCNGQESCDADAGCVAGDEPCSDELCNEATDQCVECLDDSDCDDGEFCNGEESCDGSGECEAGNDPCPESSCDENNNRCVDCMTDADCDDGMFCNGMESCVLNEWTCSSGTPPICDDGLVCTSDSCDPARNKCMFELDRSACDDGLFCNGTEDCGEDLGCVAGVAPCGDLLCDEDNDRCVSCRNDADCDNGVFCDGVEKCDLVADRCYRGQAMSCNDQNDCTTDRCDEATVSCVHTPDHNACDDGVFCNGAERCDAQEGCVDGDAPCGDGFCDEQSDSCVDCRNDADCDNGVYCDGAESCNSDTGECLQGNPPCSDEQKCDEENEACPSTVVSIDVKPAQCPNIHKPLKNEFLKVAIMGSKGLDVSKIDVGSVVLMRADGTGTAVVPLERKHQRKFILNDVATDKKGESCNCSGLGGDGIADLVLKFENEKLVQHMQLNKLKAGTEIDLVVTGQMLDGTPFSAMDCVQIGVPPKKTSKR